MRMYLWNGYETAIISQILFTVIDLVVNLATYKQGGRPIRHRKSIDLASTCCGGSITRTDAASLARDDVSAKQYRRWRDGFRDERGKGN